MSIAITACIEAPPPLPPSASPRLGWTTNQAVAWLKQAAPPPITRGFTAAPWNFAGRKRPPWRASSELPEVVKTSSLVETMVRIDEEFARLKAAQKVGWKNIPGQPALTARAHGDDFVGTRPRTGALDDTRKRPEDYRSKLAATEMAAERFGACCAM
jgi:hypothetical protein